MSDRYIDLLMFNMKFGEIPDLSWSLSIIESWFMDIYGNPSWFPFLLPTAIRSPAEFICSPTSVLVSNGNEWARAWPAEGDFTVEARWSVPASTGARDPNGMCWTCPLGAPGEHQNDIKMTCFMTCENRFSIHVPIHVHPCPCPLKYERYLSR